MKASLWPRRLDEALIATNGERLLGYGAAIMGAGFAAALAITAGLPSWAAIVLTLMGFNLFGGGVVNATPSGSRRFHSAGRPRWAGLGFVAGHVHPLLLAVLTPAMPWSTAAMTYGGIVLASALIVLSGALQQASAFALAALLLAPLVSILPAEPVVAWVAPLLVIKLLLSHLLPHAPPTEPLT